MYKDLEVGVAPPPGSLSPAHPHNASAGRQHARVAFNPDLTQQDALADGSDADIVVEEVHLAPRRGATPAPSRRLARAAPGPTLRPLAGAAGPPRAAAAAPLARFDALYSRSDRG